MSQRFPYRGRSHDDVADRMRLRTRALITVQLCHGQSQLYSLKEDASARNVKKHNQTRYRKNLSVGENEIYKRAMQS
jgi:hypothetical protein